MEKNILTPKQMQVLNLIAQGKQNKEIAMILNISNGTVKCHISEIFFRLEVRNRIEAIFRGFRLGLLKL